MATSNVSGGMNYTATNSGSGQRAAGGADPWVWPALQTTSSMSGSTFTVTDMNDALTTTQDDWDLNASNLDGAGTRSFAALSGFIIITYISGTGSVAVAPGTTNPATWFPTCTLGGGATQTRQVVVYMTATSLVSGTVKTVDLTVTGSVVYSVRVAGGTAVN
jgi:hypothetical protein